MYIQNLLALASIDLKILQFMLQKKELADLAT